eukprot:15322406-Alexandrium_andersonii.AAC.1
MIPSDCQHGHLESTLADRILVCHGLEQPRPAKHPVVNIGSGSRPVGRGCSPSLARVGGEAKRESTRG